MCETICEPCLVKTLSCNLPMAILGVCLSKSPHSAQNDFSYVYFPPAFACATPNCKGNTLASKAPPVIISTGKATKTLFGKILWNSPTIAPSDMITMIIVISKYTQL